MQIRLVAYHKLDAIIKNTRIAKSFTSLQSFYTSTNSQSFVYKSIKIHKQAACQRIRCSMGFVETYSSASFHASSSERSFRSRRRASSHRTKRRDRMDIGDSRSHRAIARRRGEESWRGICRETARDSRYRSKQRI